MFKTPRRVSRGRRRGDRSAAGLGGGCDQGAAPGEIASTGAADVSKGRPRGGWALLGSGDGAPDHPSNLVRESAVLRRSAVRDGAGSPTKYTKPRAQHTKPRAQRGCLDWAHSGRAAASADDAHHPPRARRNLTLYYRKRSGRSPEQRVCPGSGGCAPFCAPIIPSSHGAPPPLLCV